MLTFITGQPGAGKTLYAVSTIDKKAKSEGRPVYYNGAQLAGVTLEGWHDIGSGFDWADAPEGAIILLDEAHRELFPMRKIGADVPEHVDAMSTHRHRGHDVFITAQHSTQVDTFIRKMAGEHHHFKRTFGSNRSTQWIWLEHANERDQWDRKKATTKSFRYPKDYFGTYKSTVLNTVKPSLPWVRIGAIALGALTVPLLLYAGVAAVWPDAEPEPGAVASVAPDGQFFGPVANNHEVETRIIDRPILYDSETWAPEIPDLPYSARLYDNIVEISDYPRVTGCMRTTYSDGQDSCSCSTQQGTRARVSYRYCRDFVDFGVFDFSGEDKNNRLGYGLSAENLARASSGSAPAASQASGAPGAAATVQ